jgi:hypothetical protein
VRLVARPAAAARWRSGSPGPRSAGRTTAGARTASPPRRTAARRSQVAAGALEDAAITPCSRWPSPRTCG